jgi:hypothetical protein
LRRKRRRKPQITGNCKKELNLIAIRFQRRKIVEVVLQLSPKNKTKSVQNRAMLFSETTSGSATHK